MSKYKQLVYKKELYEDFNKQIRLGKAQGLVLYNPIKDLTLIKDVKKIDDEIIIEKKINEEKRNNLINDFQGILSNVMFGNVGTDIYNYNEYKNGDADKFESKTIKFYNEGVIQPLKDVSLSFYDVYKNEILTIAGITLITIILIKKI